MVKISAVILTFNEERNIARCIASVKPVADEIVVVDSFSTDKTAEICKSFDVKFIQHPFNGYIEQKNYAITVAGHDHILSLDADEALSDALTASIIQVKSNWDHDVYSMNRLTNYCGKWIYHSGWYPDVKIRLFGKNSGSWGGMNPHDKWMVKGSKKVKHLKGDLLHYSYYTIEEHEKQVVKFAEIAAGSLYRDGKRANMLMLIYKPVARFLRTYVVKQGFRDGKAGWTISRLTAWSSYLRYKNLYRLHGKG